MNALLNLLIQESEDLPPVSIMEFCGGHTHAFSKTGLYDLLPPALTMVAGPGCPVCVLPGGRLKMAMDIAMNPGVILCTFGDMQRVPVGGDNPETLFSIRAKGGDVRTVYSPSDAVKIAAENLGREVVFFAVGFETTAPATALAVTAAEKEGVKNFSVFCNHVLTPPALRGILEGSRKIDAVIAPGHVAAVIGAKVFEDVAREYVIPTVVAGFETDDLLRALIRLVQRIKNGKKNLFSNEYKRAVSEEGNRKAQDLMRKVFSIRKSFAWRGFGSLQNSALSISENYRSYDAEQRFSVKETRISDPPGCSCPDVIRGLRKPTECALFGKKCTPQHPVGACMVSDEGACAAEYGRTDGMKG